MNRALLRNATSVANASPASSMLIAGPEVDVLDRCRLLLVLARSATLLVRKPKRANCERVMLALSEIGPVAERHHGRSGGWCAAPRPASTSVSRTRCPA